MRASTQGESEVAAAGREFAKPQRLGDPYKRNGSGTAEVRRPLDVVSRSQGLINALLHTSVALGGRAHISRPFEESTWVHAALRRRANAVRTLPVRLWKGDPLVDKDATVVESHPVVELFAAPNQHMTTARFFEAGMLHRALTGEDFWLCYDKDGNPVQADEERKIPLPAKLWPASGRLVSHRCGPQGFVDMWRVSLANGQGGQEFKPGSAIQFADYDPDNPLRGLGDVECLLRSLDLYFQAERYQEAVLANSGDPGGTLLIEEELQRSEEKALEREANDAMGPENRGRMKVVSGKGIKYEPNRLGPKEMEFKDLRTWVRSEIATTLGVPLPLLGDTSASTYDNMAAAVRDFWQGGNGVLSYVHSVEDVVNNLFLPKLKGPSVDGLFFRFDLSRIEAIQEDQTAKLEQARKLMETVPGITWHEAVTQVGIDLPPVGFGDQGWVKSGTVTVEHALESEAAPDPEPEVPEGDDEPEAPEEEPEADEPEEDEEDEARAARGIQNREADVEAATARRVYWKSVETDVLDPGEKDIAQRYTRWSRRYEKAQIKRLEDFAARGEDALRHGAPVTRDDDDDLRADQLEEEDLKALNLDAKEWERRLSDEVGPGIERVFSAAADNIAAELGVTSIPGTDPRVRAFLLNQTVKLAEGHNSYLASRVRSSLVRALKDSQTVGSLQDIVRENLPELTDELRRVFGTRDARALTIARTETAGASNGARFMEMRENGVEEHEWVTSGDTAVRGHPSDDPTIYSHYDLDGKVVRVGDFFARALQHPCDPDAAAGDVINCRCITRPAKDSEE